MLRIRQIKFALRVNPPIVEKRLHRWQQLNVNWEFFTLPVHILVALIIFIGLYCCLCMLVLCFCLSKLSIEFLAKMITTCNIWVHHVWVLFYFCDGNSAHHEFSLKAFKTDKQLRQLIAMNPLGNVNLSCELVRVWVCWFARVLVEVYEQNPSWLDERICCKTEASNDSIAHNK